MKNELTALAAVLYENERPLQGFAGQLDWNFHGEISNYLKKGYFSGKVGECVYLPIHKREKVFHLILVGGGNSGKPGQRRALNKNTIEGLKKSIQSLKLKNVGVAISDFGGLDEKALQKDWKGISVCFLK